MTPKSILVNPKTLTLCFAALLGVPAAYASASDALPSGYSQRPLILESHDWELTFGFGLGADHTTDSPARWVRGGNGMFGLAVAVSKNVQIDFPLRVDVRVFRNDALDLVVAVGVNDWSASDSLIGVDVDGGARLRLSSVDSVGLFLSYRPVLKVSSQFGAISLGQAEVCLRHDFSEALSSEVALLGSTGVGTLHLPRDRTATAKGELVGRAQIVWVAARSLDLLGGVVVHLTKDSVSYSLSGGSSPAFMVGGFGGPHIGAQVGLRWRF